MKLLTAFEEYMLKDLLIPQAHAQVDIGAVFPPAASFSTPAALVNVIVRNGLTLAGIVAVVAVIFSGIKIIQGSGDAKATEQNKGAFTAAVVGLIIIVGAYFIVEVLGTILGFNLLNPTIP